MHKDKSEDLPSSSHVSRLLRLPKHHASRQKQEEAAEENGEENEQINMELILPVEKKIEMFNCCHLISAKNNLPEKQ